MKTIQGCDPALCRNTGVLGTDVDQTLASLSVGVDWAKQAGVQVERFNMAQQPLAFAENTLVKGALEKRKSRRKRAALHARRCRNVAVWPLFDPQGTWPRLGHSLSQAIE